MASKRKKPLTEKLTGPAAARYGPLPKVPLPGDNELHISWNESVASILKDKGLYRRDILPVVPFESKLLQMKPTNFITWSQKFFVPYKTRIDRNGDPYEVLKDMTESVAHITLESLDFVMQLPAINRIYPSPVPIINDQDILIFCTPGYDPGSGTYVFNSGLTPDQDTTSPDSHLVSSEGYLDDSLSLTDAVWGLYELHKEFPFSDWGPYHTPSEDSPFWKETEDGKPPQIRLARSLAVQIAGMLALFAGGCVPQESSRLGFIMNASSQRSGKTLLGKIMTAPIHGKFRGLSWKDKDDEMTKILDSEVLAASPYICFDNVRATIMSAPLEGFMTTPMHTGRHLGRSEMFVAENNAVILITGNNLNVGTDIQHRTLYIDLYVEEADIQSRKVANPIDDVWLGQIENRRRILSYLWAIVRHWDAAGRPLATGNLRNGFERWCSIIGGMVEFAGFGDMLAPAVLENAGDDEDNDINALVTLLAHASGSGEFTFQEVVHTAWENGLFPWVMHGREETLTLKEGWASVLSLKLDGKNNSRFGHILGRHTKGERGGIFTVRMPDRTLVKYRFYLKGKGRHRRYHVKPHATINRP